MYLDANKCTVVCAGNCRMVTLPNISARVFSVWACQPPSTRHTHSAIPPPFSFPTTVNKLMTLTRHWALE